ncbi:MAG TPA: hypothetical protein VMR52_06935 [Dehalococcoidia bacterium]|nr:hypothetical protein [Dehalococcoidia bacterium]
MQRLLILILLSFVLAFAGIAACGDDDDGDLEEYFAEVEVIAITTDHALDTLGDELSAAEPETDEEYIQVFQESYQGAGEVLETAYLDLAEMTPPAEAESAHDSFLDSLEGVLIALSGILENSQEVTTADELDVLYAQFEPDLVQVDENLDTACATLQGVAESNGISADLRCGD